MIEYENLNKLNKILFTKYEKTFSEVMNSGWYILGNNVLNFERNFAKYCGTDHFIGLASGLDALILAIDSLCLPPQSEIIVPSNTYIATILAIIKTGHLPVLVEPDITTYNIDPKKIETHITTKTKAILVVHLYGKCCDMEAIVNLTKKYKLHLIEDVAQAHGAKFKNQNAGTFGIGCFSFYPTKNLGALGDAGGIATSDKQLNDRLRTLRNYGSNVKYYNELVGYNSRLDEIQAAFLNVKLEILDEINEHKRKLAKIYHETISNEYIKPVIDTDYYDVYHIYNIRHQSRDLLKKYLANNGVMSEIHYPLAPHKQIAMKEILKGHYPISEEIHATTLSLPISYFHTEEDILKVSKLLNIFLEQHL